MNKTIKKILSASLALILLFSAFSITSFAQGSMSDDFKKILNDDGELEINWAPPKHVEVGAEGGLPFSVQQKLEEKFGLKTYFDAQSFVDSDYKQAKITLKNDVINGDDDETHTVNIKFNYDQEVFEKFKKIESNLSSVDTVSLSDLELFNYWVSNPNERFGSTSILNYIPEISRKLNYENLNIYAYVTAGADPFCFSGYLCSMYIEYADVVYYSKNFLVTAPHYIAVPSSTGNSEQELMAAAQKRLDEYFGNGVTEIVPTLKFNDGYDYFEEFINTPIEGELGYDWSFLKKSPIKASFSLKINGKYYENSSHDFVIIKDDALCNIPHHKTVDFDTKLSVETDAYVPLDSLISVQKLTEGAEYDNVMSKIKVSNSEMFDLKLFSKHKNSYITKLDNGSFEVRIPITEKFKDKKLVVYYVNDNGMVDEHEVSIKDGFAVFNTNHFSIYTLAEKASNNQNIKDNEITSPKTEDKSDIAVFIILCILLISGIGIIVFSKKLLKTCKMHAYK